jgi:N-acetyl-anhydromuramyl-L-alanine amidase AmpD
MVIGLSSCETVPTQTSQAGTPIEMVYTSTPYPIVRSDLCHEVAPGETLWRISKMYDVKIEEILKANNLKLDEELHVGQRLTIPQAAPVRPVIPLYPSQKWQYIIIHHSATDMGSALRFNSHHLRRLWKDGLGYHFVIDNGTCNKVDGQVEISPRWIKQQDGAHCRASGMNYKAIGICLVGNFDKETVSEKQLNALVDLVRILRDYYHIPLARIKGHGQVEGAATDCPGKNFPWKEFFRRLTLSEQKR